MCYRAVRILPSNRQICDHSARRGAGDAGDRDDVRAADLWRLEHSDSDPRLLSADYFVVSWSWDQYASAILLALVSVFIASYVPARRAAELPPVNTLRGSSV